MIIIITAPSAAGKTTIVSKILADDSSWLKPINFTTRKPRGDDGVDIFGDFGGLERSDYIFLTENQFLLKRAMGDFAETTYYNCNFYGVSRFFDKDKKYIAIMEPEGRAELEDWCLANGQSYKKIYIDITPETAVDRLKMRGENDEFIKARLKDFDFFEADGGSYVVDGNGHIDDVVAEVKAIIN